jgi:hypothetical protein
VRERSEEEEEEEGNDDDKLESDWELCDECFNDIKNRD